jgi:hypothetical protein
MFTNKQTFQQLSVKTLLFSLVLISSFFPIFLQGQVCDRNIYRSIDGSCNNLQSEQSKNWGATQNAFLRELPAQYSSEDSLNGLRFPTRPNPRAISNKIFNQGDSEGNPNNLSSFVYAWGQFLDHDITFTKGSRAESAPILLPSDEPNFTRPISFHRSAIAANTGVNTARNQENGLTAWIDASNVYGSDTLRANWLRTFQGGKLKVSSGNLMPYNTLNAEKDGPIDPNAPEMDHIGNGRTIHFVAGDARANEQPGLTSLHTLFVREHNRICDNLILNGQNNDELNYQTARKQIGALIQAITYEEFLPALKVQIDPYTGYDATVNPDIMNLFATAAFRFGHTMVPSDVKVINDDCTDASDPLVFERIFFNNKWIEEMNIDPFLKGLNTQPQEAIDAKVVDALRNFLFSIPQVPGSFGLDLAALNIQRGRDHGLPDYNTVRERFTGSKIISFNQLTSNNQTAQTLANLYQNNTENVDLWVALLVEDKMNGSTMGITMHNILKTQFERIRNGDYYYYQNDPQIGATEKQTIKNTKLSDIIKNNTSIKTLPKNVFIATPCEPIIAGDCNQVKVNAIAGGLEILDLNAAFKAVKVLDKKNGWRVAASCYGEDCGINKTFSLPASDYYVQVQFYEGFWSNLLCQREWNISVEGNGGGGGNTGEFDCETVEIKTTNNVLEISNLTAPFKTIKIYDRNAGWSVVQNCHGDNCQANQQFQLANGNYQLEIKAYKGPWNNLICEINQPLNITGNGTGGGGTGGGTGGSNNPNCDDITVNQNGDKIEINGLKGPFTTVKVFDANKGWEVVANCKGDQCSENQSFTVGAGNYYVETTIYKGPWTDQICKKLFPININNLANNREGNQPSVFIYPNPVLDHFFVDLKKYAGKEAHLSLFNQYGQIIQTKDFQALPPDLVRFQLNNIPNGIYHLQIKVDNKQPISKKIILGNIY